MNPRYPQLRDDVGDPDPDAIVEEFFPYDGPYSGWITGSASTLIGRLSRYLANATGKRSAVPSAPSVGRILDGLHAASYSLDQTVTQLARYAVTLGSDRTLYDDRRDRPAHLTAGELADALDAAHRAFGALQAALQNASSVASHLGHDTSGGES